MSLRVKRNFRVPSPVSGNEDGLIGGWEMRKVDGVVADRKASNDLTPGAYMMNTKGLTDSSLILFGNGALAGAGFATDPFSKEMWVRGNTFAGKGLAEFSNASKHRRGLTFDGSSKLELHYGAQKKRVTKIAPLVGNDHWNHIAARVSGVDRWQDLTTGARPAQRELNFMTYDPLRDRIVLFGGSSNDGSGGHPFVFYDDTWEYNPNDNTWTEFPNAGGGVARRGNRNMCWFDPARGRVRMWGGVHSDRRENVLYEWNGETWDVIPQINAPSARSGSPVAYDTARNKLVLYGGQLGAGVNGVDETWELDNDTWTQLSPVATPPARLADGMAFHAGIGQVVMYGGFQVDPFVTVQDTWAFDGTTWTDLSPATTPDMIFTSALVYDAARDVLVLIHGATAGFVFNEDVWEFDGTDWVDVTSPSSPLSRQLEAVYDLKRGRVFIFGGDDGTGGFITKLDDWWVIEPEATVWVNGEELVMTEEVASAIGKGASSLFVGRKNLDAPDVIAAEYDNLRIYDRVLSDEEIVAACKRGARVPSLLDDLSDAVVQSGVASSALPSTIWRAGPTNWGVAVRTGEAGKALVAGADGFVSTPQALTYGTWEVRARRDAGNEYEALMVAGMRGSVSNAAQNGYGFHVAADGTLSLRKRTAGVSADLFSTAAGFIADSAYYSLRATRNEDGTFAVYSNDGTGWALAAAATGSNPVVDTAHGSSRYVVIEADAVDEFTDLRVYHGALDPLEGDLG